MTSWTLTQYLPIFVPAHREFYFWDYNCLHIRGRELWVPLKSSRRNLFDLKVPSLSVSCGCVIMMTRTSKQWWHEMLLPNIPPIDIGNAPSHSHWKEEYPVHSWTKKCYGLPQKWFPLNASALNRFGALPNIIGQLILSIILYHVDGVAKQASHKVVQLPAGTQPRAI